MTDEPILDGKVRMLKYEFEVIVSFVELVPEEEIGLFES